jgi:hypothetical protein
MSRLVNQSHSTLSNMGDTDSLKGALTTLGLDPETAKWDDVLTEYKQLVLQYQPNALPGQGITDLEIALVQNAMSTLMKHFDVPHRVETIPYPRWCAEPLPEVPAPPATGEPIPRFCTDDESSVRIGPTGLPISTSTGDCVCAYCAFQCEKGGQMAHTEPSKRQVGADEWLSETYSKVYLRIPGILDTPTLNQLYDSLPVCDYWKSFRPDMITHVHDSLDRHMYLATCTMQRVMEKILVNEGLPEQAEKWSSFRDSFPFTDRPELPYGQSPKYCLPLYADFPQSSLAAAANFCILTVRDLQKIEEQDMVAAKGDDNIAELGEKYLQMRIKQVKRWRRIIQILMPVTHCTFSPTARKKRLMVIARLTEVVVRYCQGEDFEMTER